MRAKFLNEKVILWGDGNQRREVIHVNDFAKNLIELNNSTENDIINIGSSSDFSIKDFAKIICEVVDYDSNKIFYDKSKYVGVFKKKLNIEKINKKIKNYEKNLLDIKVGIKEVVEWYKSTEAFKW